MNQIEKSCTYILQHIEQWFIILLMVHFVFYVGIVYFTVDVLRLPLFYVLFFFGRKGIPFTFLLWYFRKSSVMKFVAYGLLWACLIGSMFFVGLFLGGFHLKALINWSYHALFTYAVGFILGVVVWRGMTRLKVATSVTLSLLSVQVAGFIYELPAMLQLQLTEFDYFHLSYPFRVFSPFVSFLMLTWILHRFRWRPEKWFYSALIVWCVTSVIYAFNLGNVPMVALWIRIPSIVLLFTLSKGITQLGRSDV